MCGNVYSIAAWVTHEQKMEFPPSKKSATHITFRGIWQGTKREKRLIISA